MNKVILYGTKLLPKPFRQPSYILYKKFSSQVDPNIQSEDPFIVPKTLYSEDEYKRIQEIQQMSYHTLLEEVKKYSNRPKTRTKNILLQFLIEQVPKKGVLSAQRDYSQDFESDQTEEYSEATQNKSYQAHIDVPKADDSEEVIKILNESSLFSSLRYEFGAAKFHIPNFFQKTLPYIENYPEKQIIEQLDQFSQIDVKREMEQFLKRSSLYSRIVPIQKIKKLSNEVLSSSFKDMIFIHREYVSFERNNLKHILSDSKGKSYNTLDCLEVLRNFENPMKLNKMHSYLKSLSANALLQFWKVIFEPLPKYDLQTIDLVLRLAISLKENYYINFIEPENEAALYELIFSQCASIVQDSSKTFSIVSLAGIISSYRKIQPFVPPSAAKSFQILGRAMLTQYSQEILDVPWEKLNLTRQEFVDIIYAEIYVGGQEISNVIPDLLKKLVAMNMKNFDKHVLKELLIYFSNMKINLTKEFAESLKENFKLTDQLTLFDVYLFLHTFKETGIEFSKIYNHLYLAFFSIVEGQQSLPDMKNILLTAKIMNEILENHLSEHRKIALEKKLNYVLMLIEKSIDILEEPIQIIDLIEISSLFMPHLNSPDFLFTKILLQIDELVITNDNKNKIAKFVNKFLDKIEPKYTFNTYLVSTDLEFNDKLTEISAGIFKKLTKKFRESHLLSYVMLNIKIACHPPFLKTIFSDQKDRIAFLEYLVRQIIGITSNNLSVSISHLKLITKWIYVNIAELNPNYVVVIHQNILPQLLGYFNKSKKTFNEILEPLYYISSSLTYHKNDTVTKTNVSHTKAVLDKISEIMLERILPAFCENASLTIQQIIYDREVSQYFNSTLFNTNFEHLEYLLPLMDALKLPLTPNVEKNVILQYPRCIKRWTGSLLVQNLLLFDKFKIHCPELFEFSIPNLFSCYIFFFDTQNLMLNKQIIDEKGVLALLRAIMNQKEKIYFKEINNSVGQTEFSTNIPSLIPLGALLYAVMNLLTPEDIKKIVVVLGDERKNYMQPFVTKFNHFKFPKLSVQEAIDLKTVLPSFLQNDEINTIVYDSILSNKAQVKHVFTIMRKEKLWIDGIIPQIIEEIESKQSKELFEELLLYLGETGIHYKDTSSILRLAQSLGIPFDDLTYEAKMNMLIYFYVHQALAKENSNSDQSLEFSESQLSILKPLCKNLLRSEHFYFYENVVVHQGKVFRIKYYGSFELPTDLISNTFKVFPRNKMGSKDISESTHLSDNDLSVTQTGINEENLLETSKAFEEQSLKKEYKNVMTKFMLYKQFHELAELSPDNENLLAEFTNLQNRHFNLVKFKEQFANFLIDITLVLHELGLMYKTNFDCSLSKMLIDVVVVDQKVAVIYVDQQEAIYELKDKKKTYHLDNFHRMKVDLLRKAGWNVIPIIYESWNAEFESKEKKEYDIKKKIDAFLSNNGEDPQSV